MIRKIIIQLQDFFGISRKEARGAFVLIILIFIMIWTPFVYRRWILPLIPVTSEPAETAKLDSIVAELSKNPAKEHSTKPYTRPDYRKAPERPVVLSRFDPNLASVHELEELGIPLFLAKRIDKYRSKGGQFRKKEDLLHIYDFPSDLFQKLEPYILLPENKAPTPVTGPSGKVYPEKLQSKTYSKNDSKPVITPFDINTTDTTRLVQLRGIGSKLSVRILKFRDALGGFYSADQFNEIYGLDSLALSELNRYARIGSPVKKLNLNTATAEELSSHSYLRNKKLASVIVNYRNQHGPYTSYEDLKKIRMMDEKAIEKLTPYLEF
jgi:competence protein ComEA